ncbi:G_PROTEIN_RECEP_F1_2 domain-containing protein [Meloidogyne graminicola]|uniref:G_PROTEIN_RECEP_F1_2 domain-containing protein n=1 Tax=Meloidogyne graminicola TaxID=189291 RepID=A0A8S9ZVN9_9BILA|nr:G_PROTEIN_RECEP_F1_2 domain-containing protein [Meloidogyne graminicola]
MEKEILEKTLEVEGIVPFFPSIMAIPSTDENEFNSSICSDLQHEDYSPLYAWFNYIIIIIMLPSLSVFGIITNLLNIFIFTRPCMKNSSNTYLLFLASSDFFVVLTGLFIFWIDSARSYIPQLVQAPYTTVYTLPFGYMAQSCSIYFTVAAAFDCYVCWRKILQFHCTIKKAKKIIIFIIICSIIYNSLRFPQFNLRKCIHNGSGEMIIEICPTYLFYYINTIYNVYLYIKKVFLLLSSSSSTCSAPIITNNNLIINSSPIIYQKNKKLKLKNINSIESNINPNSDETITMIMVVILFLCCNTLSLIVNLIETFFEPDPLLLNLLSDAIVFNSSVNCNIEKNYFLKCFEKNEFINNGNLLNNSNVNNSKYQQQSSESFSPVWLPCPCISPFISQRHFYLINSLLKTLPIWQCVFVNIKSQQMIILLITAFNLLFLLSKSDAKLNKTTTRKGYDALWNLNQMSECRLGYSAIAYNDYGCWYENYLFIDFTIYMCGIGGVGRPMDKIDSCCMIHDKCYDAAVDKGICFDVEFEYIDDYSWECKVKEPNCPISLKGCQAALCHCDKQVVDCWANFPKPQLKAKCTHGDRPISHLLSIVIDSFKIAINFVVSLPNFVVGFLFPIIHPYLIVKCSLISLRKFLYFYNFVYKFLQKKKIIINSTRRDWSIYINKYI